MDAYVAVSYDVVGARSDSKIDRTAMVKHLRESGRQRGRKFLASGPRGEVRL